MAIPIIYNIRNLRLRPGAALMTTLGIALTVAVALFIMALFVGLEKAFVETGDRLNLIVMRKAAQAELQSFVTQESFQTIKSLPGVAKNGAGEPLASGEVVVVIVLPRSGGNGEANVTVRGLMPAGLELRPKVRIAEGRWFSQGQREIVVSRSVGQRFAGTKVGDSIQFGKGSWKVVGIFDAGETAFGSEVWADVNQLASDFERAGTFSSLLLRAADPVALQGLKNRVSDDQRLKLEGTVENDYYSQQTKAGRPIQYVGTVVALIMAFGSCFAAMNTMYAAVANRSREIATLRILGFSRPSILTSFIIESVLLSLLGAALGLLVILPFNGLTTGTENSLTYSEAVFTMKIGAGMIAAAVLFAVGIGLFGGFAPAWHASRREILAALRG